MGKQYLLPALVIALLFGGQWWMNQQDATPQETNETVAAATPSSAPIFIVDATRIINAQRRLLSESLIGNQDAITTTAYSGRQAEDVIRAIAGKDGLVLVKQAVIVAPAHAKDITNEVLSRLGLPQSEVTQAPLSDAYMLKGNQYSDSSVYESLRERFDEKRKGWDKADEDDAQAYLP